MYTFALPHQKYQLKTSHTYCFHDKSIYRNKPKCALRWPKLYWDFNDWTEWLTNWLTDRLLAYLSTDAYMTVYNMCKIHYKMKPYVDVPVHQPQHIYTTHVHFFPAQRYLTSNQRLLLQAGNIVNDICISCLHFKWMAWFTCNW